MSDDRKRVEELTLTEPGGAESANPSPITCAKYCSRSARIPNRDGLRHTPERFEKALRFLTSGYQQDPEKLLNGAMFSVCYDQMVLVKDIEFYSLCEHHMLPFFGKCHVAYIPDKKVVGPVENSAAGEHVRAAAADSGAADQPDRQRHPGENRSAGRGRGDRRRGTCAW